ncbi:MAG: hypothetical protein HY720_14260 [Planctomycetes bacterium]|nr:hypothetical protein [Planctomycetota bacterium]
MTFDFPGSVRLVANARDPATPTLRARFARFETANDGAAPSVGVVVEPLVTGDIEGDSAWWTHSPYGMGFGFHRGRRAVILPRRGEADVALVPDDPVGVHYRARSGCERRVYGIVLFALALALARRGGLLLHAAGAVRGGRAVLVAGPRGSRKTQILLDLLRDGWDYLSEDKLLLARGMAHVFQSEIGIRDHHFESVSWLPNAWPPRLSRGTRSLARGIRRRAAALAVRMLPSRLIPPVARRFDPVHPVEARELFPEIQVAPPVAPAAVALLSRRTQGRELSCEPLGAPEALEELAAIQELVFHELAPLDRLVRLCDPGPRVDPRGLLERELAGCRFVRLSIGRDAGVEGAPRLLAERLESIGEGT